MHRRPTSADVGGQKLAIKPRRAPKTKEQRHEQEIYFGVNACLRYGIRADRQCWLDTRSAATAQPAAHKSIYHESLNDRPEQPELFPHQHERSAGIPAWVPEAGGWKLGARGRQRPERKSARRQLHAETA